MRICLLSSYLINDATTIRAKNIAKYLIEEGFEVTLIASDYKKRVFFKDGVKICTDRLFDIHYVPRYVLKSSNRLAFLLKEDFDILHVFAPMPASVPVAYLTKKIKRRPLIVDWDDWEAAYEGEFFSSFHEKFVEFCEKFIIEHADGVVVTSKKLQELAGKWGRDAIYLPNGCDSSRIPNITKKHARETLNMDLDETIFIFTGTLVKTIGLERYINAFKDVKEGKFYFVGGGEIEHFKNLVRKLKIGDRVVFTGAVSAEKIPIFLKAADIGILPLTNTPYNQAKSPMKLGEYITFDLPILGDRVGEIKNFLDDGGFLVSEDSEIYPKMKEALDPKKRRNATRNYKKMKEKFGWENQIKKLIKLYDYNMSFH